MRDAQDAPGQTVTRMRDPTEGTTVARERRYDFDINAPFSCRGVPRKRHEELLLETPQSLWDRFRIRTYVGAEVTAIDTDGGRLQGYVSGAAISDQFDRLILAPGSVPIAPTFPGTHRDDVFIIRTVPDAIRLREYIESHQVEHAVVIGAGFIGLEMAEVLHTRSISVTLIERADQVLPPVDRDIAQYLEDRLPDLDVRLILSNTVIGIRQGYGRPVIDLSSAPSVSADMIIIGLGVRPSTHLAQAMGLALGPTGAIHVDERMQTSHPRIWAAGDAVEKRDWVTGQPRWWPLAGVANKEGRVAGSNAAGGYATLKGALGTSIVRIAPYVVGVTGLTEKAAHQDRVGHTVTRVMRGHHAAYYPGAHTLFIKILSDPDSGRLLGAQVVGEEGVDKRIDVLATAIGAGMTIDDLAELDLAYAPPIGAVKDPVIIAGMAASNQRQGLIESISADDLETWLTKPNAPFVLDVREVVEADEFGYIPGAHLIPLNGLRSRIQEVPTDGPIVTYCRTGHRSYLAARILSQHGRTAVYNLSGGLSVWNLSIRRRAKPIL